MSSIPVQLPLFPVDGKVCRICGALQPVEAFNFHDKAAGRRRSTCQSCDRAKTTAWRDSNPERAKAGNAAWRKAHPAERKAHDAAYYLRHRDQVAARAFAWRAANLERHTANCKAWHEANRDRHSALTGAWGKRNPERRNAINAAWARAHPGKVRAKAHRRRGYMLANGGHYTGAQWRALKARYDHRCLMCKRQEPAITLTFDHIVPVSKGGRNDIGNGQPLCGDCNRRKGAKTLDLR